MIFGIFLQLPEVPLLLPGGGGGVQRAWRALQEAEGHQPSTGARSRYP